MHSKQILKEDFRWENLIALEVLKSKKLNKEINANDLSCIFIKACKSELESSFQSRTLS